MTDLRKALETIIQTAQTALAALDNLPITSIKNSSKPTYDHDFQAAQLIQLDLTCPPAVVRMWGEWQQYRTRRHTAKGKEKLAWTEQAARLSAEAINRAVLQYGEQIVAGRITAAIAGSWQGLNLDKLEHETTHGTTHQRNNRDPQYGAFNKTSGSPSAGKSGRVL